MHSDTLLLTPIRTNGLPSCDCNSNAEDCIFCQPDTLLYKDNALWYFNEAKRQLFREYERKS